MRFSWLGPLFPLYTQGCVFQNRNGQPFNLIQRGVVMQVNCPVVGIDVGKSSSYYCVLTSGGRLHRKPARVGNDAKGLTKLLKSLKRAEEALETKPAILLESTGHYSERLVCLFIRNHYKVFLINPLQSHSIKNVSIRKVKTDKMDCEEIAKLFFILDLWEYQMPDNDLANLKILTRAYQKMAKYRNQTVNQLTSNIDQVWPGFTEIFAVDSKTAQSLLLAYPAPAQLLDAPKQEIIELIRAISRSGLEYAKEKYKALQQCARDSLIFGTQQSGYFICIELHVSMLQQIDARLNQLEAEIETFAIKVPAVELLKTIPGIGPKLAATIAAEIGDINRFGSAKQLVAYFGVDPSVKQSGNFLGTKNKLTKRGSPFARRALYLAAMVSVRDSKRAEYPNKVIHDYYNKKKKNKAKKQALGAVMNKLVRIIYSVLKNKRAFVMITPEEHNKLHAAGLLPAA